MDDLLNDCLIEALQRYIYESLQQKFPTDLTKILTIEELTLKVTQLKAQKVVDADRIHNIDQICQFIQTRTIALAFLKTNLQTFTADELEYYLNALDRDTMAIIALLSGERTVAKTADCRIFAGKTNPFVNGTYLLSLKPFYTSGWYNHKLSDCIQTYFVNVIIDHDHYQRRYGNAKRQQWLDLHKSLLQQAQLAQAQIAEQKQAKIEQDELAERQQANAETAKTKMREILRQHQVGVESELEVTKRKFEQSKALILEFSGKITQLEADLKQYQQTDKLKSQQLQEHSARIQELTSVLEQTKKMQDESSQVIISALQAKMESLARDMNKLETENAKLKKHYFPPLEEAKLSKSKVTLNAKKNGGAPSAEKQKVTVPVITPGTTVRKRGGAGNK